MRCWYVSAGTRKFGCLVGGLSRRLVAGRQARPSDIARIRRRLVVEDVTPRVNYHHRRSQPEVAPTALLATAAPIRSREPRCLPMPAKVFRCTLTGGKLTGPA